MITLDDEVEKFELIMMMHFPGVVPGRDNDLICENCQDLKNGDCEGKNLKGMDVVKCMEEKLNKTIIEIHMPIMH